MNIIPTNINYTYSILNTNILELSKVFPFLTVQSVGKSVMGKNLYVLQLGSGTNKVFYSAGFHANEWITSIILIKFIEDLCKLYINNSYIYGHRIKDILNYSSLFIMPMINPDGIDLVNGSIPSNSFYYKKAKKISLKYPNISFPNGWKSNINGVDLNLQFPTGWESAKKIKFSQGYISPAPRDFVGLAPLTEPEALAVYNLTLKNEFDLVLCYHTQGKEIYWKYKNFIPKNSLKFGKHFSKVSNYILANTPYNSSFAGYKDWFIEKYNKPRIYY